MPARFGFTLLEVLLVVMILAIVLAVATASLVGPVRRAKITQAYDRLETVDRFVRTAARRDNVAYRILFDRKKGVIETHSTIETKRKNIRSWPLPRGVEMLDFLDARGMSNRNQNEVLVASNGTSPSYAVSIETSEGKKNWLVTFGFSGQQVRIEEEADVAAIFAQ